MRKPRAKVIIAPVLIAIAALWALGRLMELPTDKAVYRSYIRNARMGSGLRSLSQRLPAFLGKPINRAASMFWAKAEKQHNAVLASPYLACISMRLAGDINSPTTRSNMHQVTLRVQSAVPDAAFLPRRLGSRSNLVDMGFYCRKEDAHLVEKAFASFQNDFPQAVPGTPDASGDEKSDESIASEAESIEILRSSL